MDERKYEIIDPDNEKFKLTAEDLISEKKKRKKGNKALKVFIALLLIFAIAVGGGAFFIDSYLSKINYGDFEGEINPNLDAEETFEFENQALADDAIRKNLDNNVLWYDERVFNVLLVGYDLGDFAEVYFPRSDSMILVSINTVKNTINMVSLSRATYVAVEGHGNKRLNTAHAYGGAAKLVETIQKNFKIRIDRYATVDFNGFSRIIDVLGGIDVHMTAKEAKYVIGKEASGNYHLNGEKALSFSRIRSIDSDRARTGRQRMVLNAIASKFKSSSVSTLVSLMDEILPLVTTNFKKTELVSQATKVPQYLSMPIKEDVIPHDAAEYAVKEGLEVLIPDWPATTEYIHQLLYPDMIPESANQN